MSDLVERNITQTVVRNDSRPAAPYSVSSLFEEPPPKRATLPPPGEPLGQQLALELLCQGIRMAQSRGTYKLEESAIFLRAINEFVVKKSSTSS